MKDLVIFNPYKGSFRIQMTALHLFEGLAFRREVRLAPSGIRGQARTGKWALEQVNSGLVLNLSLHRITF